MAEASSAINVPSDRLNLVYVILLIHGVGVLMPWNMFITAKDYFTEYKLSKNYTSTGEDSEYVSNFMQYLTFCSQVPNLFFNWMNIFVQIKGGATTKIIWSIAVEVVVFIFTIILAMVDSSTWPDPFFYLTLISVVVLNGAGGIYQNTIFGMAAKLPPKYTGAVILGSNISGTFTVIVDIIARKLTKNVRMAAIYYFISALLVLLVCFDTYFALPLNRFYRHYKLKEKKTEQTKINKKQVGADEIREVQEKIPYWDILKKSSVQLYNVFIVFFVTLSIFPAVQSNIQASDKDFFLGNDFMSITCFLTFNLFAMIGSTITYWISWPRPKYLWIFVTTRLIFIPLFLFCNYQVKDVTRRMPVLISNDWIYWIIGVLMAFTSGYFSSLAMMYTPRMVEERYAGFAGMFAGAFLITGIFVGILSTFLWPLVIEYFG